MATFKMRNENEVSALITYFGACGVSATSKGLIVKAKGDDSLLDYLYTKFVTNVLL